ncbi:hypothetical protein GBA63_17685 [Rubrobacter tropicus]|uniref:Uncharacterized protein n=1 Tax=Rubrobacter tropicus TaxID=2653851 RepID=A0A6G8QDE5_9ACTN|nr:hypothetical protein [Rubrobacter tropicus]QIN84277.1 hypothetical protein GBA63_17685 [Rubrobacter tropicus]
MARLKRRRQALYATGVSCRGLLWHSGTSKGPTRSRCAPRPPGALKSGVAQKIVRVLSGDRPRSPVNEPAGRGPDG